MRSLLGTLILLCGFGYEHGSYAANILVYSPSYSQSHLITNALMADILAEEAGHNVVMFIPEYHETNFNGTKHAKIIRMSGISDSFDENMKDFSAGFIKDHTLSFRLRKLFEEATSEQCEAILRRKSELEQLRSYNFDLAFSEQLDLCGVGIIRYLGIKNHIWISSSSMMDGLSDTLGVPMPISYVPSVEENDLSTEMSFMERAQNMYLWIVSIVLHRYGAHVLTGKFRELADPNFPSVREIAAESALCFVSSDEFLDVARPILHKTIYIGGFGVPNDPQPLDEPYRSMMKKGKKGVILVSLGTVVPSSKLTDQMREDFFKLFKHFSDYHFIWKIDEQDEKARKLAAGLKNIDLVRWIPQKDMLGHPRLKLFVMHGGFYGMIEAAIRGTPLLVIPFFADQFRNGRAAETRGIGRSLQKYDLNYAKLSEALDDLLNNSKYLKASKRLSEMIKNKPNKPREQLIKWTNFVVQFGSLPELSVEGAKLNFIKYFCIDVIAALICLIVIIFVVIIRILKFIWMLFPMNNTRMVHKKKL